MANTQTPRPIPLKGTRIFISYHSADRALVRACAPALEANGCTAYWKPHFTARDVLSEEAATQIEQCDMVVLLLSSAAKESQHVGYEVGLARALRKPILPFVLELNTSIPEALGGNKLFHSDLYNVTSTTERVEEVLNRVQVVMNIMRRKELKKFATGLGAVSLAICLFLLGGGLLLFSFDDVRLFTWKLVMGVQDRERMVLIHPRPYQRQWKDEHGAAIKAPDKPYWIDRHEVSAREMNRYGEAAGEATGGLGPNRGSPAVNITVYRARSYCRARGGDLPTLAQWRYATVGNSVRPYPWGVEAPGKERVVWHWPDRQEEGPAPVEQEVQRDVTPNGVWHLAGNIQEWTLQPVEGTKKNKGRVVGGSYRTLPSEVLKIQKWLGSLGAFVAENQPAKALHIGFRCAMKATL